ncbi:hypothetical protein BJ875DRAFT_113788 [Amylocarpus encephaloides]|uniref:Hydrophobin n=1 Tax=Amylocarpus encephaloides TaxID=45428 RepID=A0A9P8C8X8_9HELO|nr:hypothetical protein BJ875DRAFT_113788 [Amylocarpus encephaloides]
MKFTSVITLLSIASLTTSSPAILDTRTTDAACNAAGGANTCCNSKFGNQNKPDFLSSLIPFLTGLLGINLDILPQGTAQVGVTCNAISVIGALNPGGKCTQQTVCCMTPQTAQNQNQGAALISILSGNSVAVCPAISV